MKPVTQEWIDKAESVEFRCPGDKADKEAREALKLCRTVRETIRLSLGLLL